MHLGLLRSCLFVTPVSCRTGSFLGMEGQQKVLRVEDVSYLEGMCWFCSCKFSMA